MKCDIACRKCSKKKRKVLKTDSYCYYTISKENERLYSNDDELREYGTKGIPDPKKYSLVNLFINGVLQPPGVYRVEKGILILKSCDLPAKGVPIILQFIKIKR